MYLDEIYGDDEDLDNFAQSLSTERLVGIVSRLEDYVLISSALLELLARNANELLELGKDILINEKGDKFLQGLSFILMYGKEPKMALEVISKRLDNLNPVILNDVMGELWVDCFQEIALWVPDQLLKGLNARYLALSQEDKEAYMHNYGEFMKAYHHRINTNSIIS